MSPSRYAVIAEQAFQYASELAFGRQPHVHHQPLLYLVLKP
jgi:hypothetical protein